MALWLVALLPLGRSLAADTAPVAVRPPVAVATTGVLRAVQPKVGLPVSAPLIPLTYYTGNHLPLFQENEHYFIALADTEYDGPRLCAFPLKPRGSQTKSGWVTPEGLLFFAYRTTSATGLFVLEEGEELKVLAESHDAYQVQLERFQQKTTLWVPKATPGARYVYVPPPPPPRKAAVKRPVRRYVIQASGSQSQKASLDRKETAAVDGPVDAAKEESLTAKISGLFTRLWSREPETPPTAVRPAPTGEVAAAVTPASTAAPPKKAAAPATKTTPPVSPPAPVAAPGATRPASLTGRVDTAQAGGAAAPLEPTQRKGLRVPAEVRVAAVRLIGAVRGGADALYEYRTALQMALAGIIVGATLYSARRRAKLRPPKSAKKPGASPEAARVEAPVPEAKPERPRRKAKARTTAETAAPPVPAAQGRETAAEGGVHFAGSLESMSLGSVAQFLNSDKESGVLMVKDQTETEVGSLIFVKGEIVDATSGSKRGVAAVYEMIRRREGSFSFARKEDLNPERTVDQGTISLVLDAYRIMDEDTSPARPG